MVLKLYSGANAEAGTPDNLAQLAASTADMTTTCGISEIARSSSFKGSFRRSKREPHWIHNIRQQLGEQLKCLDWRQESQVSMLYELQDFFKRRAEVDMEYSKNLDRLVKQIMVRHKAEKQKREGWPGFSTYTCWQTLLSSTKRESKDHAILSEIYNLQMSSRLQDIIEDVQRIYRQCREIGFACHEELLKVLNELQSSMKTYHEYHGLSLEAEKKLRNAESQKNKVEQHTKGTLSRKFKNFEKQTEKRLAKYSECKLKALKARNEYLLCIEAANAAIRKYYVDDLPDLIDCIDLGYHNSLARAMMMFISGEKNQLNSKESCVSLMNKCVTELDQRSDKQHFLENNNQAFSLPKNFDFQAHKGDEVCQISAQKPVQDELVDRLAQLDQRLSSLKLEHEEIWKTIETADRSLMVMIDQKDYDVTSLFQEDRNPPKSPHEYVKKRSDRLETEQFYIEKFHGALLGGNKIARLQARFSSVRKALGDGQLSNSARPPSLPPKPKKRKIGRAPLVGQPKLFGGSIEEYVEATSQEIPLVVRSCIKILNMYGMHHQGVFRVSGSQHEINEFKNSFERGEDPLEDVIDSKDINSVAGVLKLYFRELREPVFPVQLFDQLVDCTSLGSIRETVSRVHNLIQTLPRPIFIVLRYLFAFLLHLSEYSDENMMDPYNLAICFGPTLLPTPPDRDQVQYQSQVNDLVKNIIIHQEEIFPQDGGVTYEKCLVAEETRDREDNLDNLSDEEDDIGDPASEEESEVREAVAQYDFIGRTGRELDFNKGDALVVFNQVSNDWWEGAFKGKEGLIPDKYILVKPRDKDEERSSLGDEDKRRSTESLPNRAFNVISKSDETLDKSASQPNISMPSTSQSDSGISHNTFPSTSSNLSSNLSSKSDSMHGSSHSLDSKDTVEDSLSLSSQSDSPSQPQDESRTTEDLAQDIDSALAEVMSGLQSLEMQQHKDRVKLQKPPAGNPKHTPDLVLDLPVTTETGSPKEHSDHSEPDSPTSTAEMFAKSNQSTMKKGTSLSMPRTTVNPMKFLGGGSTRGGAGEGGGGLIVPTQAELGLMRRSHSTNAAISARNKTKVKPNPAPQQERLLDPANTIPEHATQSATVVSKSRTLPVRPPPLPEHKTPPTTDKNTSGKSRSLPNRPNIAIRPLTPDRSLTPDRALTPERLTPDRSVTPERPVTPDRSLIQTKSIGEHEGVRVLPPGGTKPPLRSKPLLMKKPGKSPEVSKKTPNTGSDPPPS